MKIEGFYDEIPVIKKITFPQKGKFNLHLEDGRIISVPDSKFTDIQKLTPKQKSKWYILGGYGFSFDDCDEVYHIEQVLGNFENYKYDFVEEPRTQYKRTKKK